MDDRPLDADGLAKAIAKMTYAELVKVGEDLFRMTQTDDGKELWDLTQKHQWADMLSNWAETRED